jgi:hypothetical protein
VWSYQEILTLAQETTWKGKGEQTVWKDLDEWVNRKISGNIRDRRKQKTPPEKLREIDTGENSYKSRPWDLKEFPMTLQDYLPPEF